MNQPDLAPNECIVCHKKHPDGENVPGWAYLAGAQPLGSLACSAECTATAVERFKRFGRTDKPLPSEGLQ